MRAPLPPPRLVAYVARLLLHAPDGAALCVPPEAALRHGGGPHAVVALHGTRTARDLFLDDLDLRPTRWPEAAPPHQRGLVHNGFARRTRAILRDIAPFLEQHDSVVFAGHSLGGACAPLAASALTDAWAARHAPRHVRHVITFGAPRVGNARFRAHYERQGLAARSVHFALPRDPVVHHLKPYVYRAVGEYTELPCDEESAWAHHDMLTYAHAVGALD